LLQNVVFVSECKYRQIFCTKFNLSFFHPKKDQCTLCNQYYGAIGNSNDVLKVQWTGHKERERQSMEAKKSDKEKPTTDTSFRAITFDLQAVLNLPHAGDAQIYYKRKLSVYNFTIYESSSKSGYCFVWDETEGHHGANEISSCLLNYLNGLPDEVKHVASFSDTCGGQNRNKFVAAAMMYAVQSTANKLEIVDLKYMERGHSYLECDSMHATIEHEKKHATLFTTKDWELLISLARKKPKPYEVIPMQHTDFSDVKLLASKLISNSSVNRNGEKVKWLNIKWMKFTRARPFVIQYKYSVSEEEPFCDIDTLGFNDISMLNPLGSISQIIPLSDSRPECFGAEFEAGNTASISTRYQQKRNSKIRQRTPPNMATITLSALYKDRIAITDAKKKDLMSLLKDSVIPADFRSFYESLPTSSSVRDSLPDRDVLDPDSESEYDDEFEQVNTKTKGKNNRHNNVDTVAASSCISRVKRRKGQVNQMSDAHSDVGSVAASSCISRVKRRKGQVNQMNDAHSNVGSVAASSCFSRVKRRKREVIRMNDAHCNVGSVAAASCISQVKKG